jgi:hypothetical protein
MPDLPLDTSQPLDDLLLGFSVTNCSCFEAVGSCSCPALYSGIFWYILEVNETHEQLKLGEQLDQCPTKSLLSF